MIFHSVKRPIFTQNTFSIASYKTVKRKEKYDFYYSIKTIDTLCEETCHYLKTRKPEKVSSLIN